MPELPEVETVKNALKLDILNKQIKKIDIFYSKIIQNVSEDEFVSSLTNQTFLDIKRKGKYLIFILNDYYLLGHMRMEGKYFLMHDEDITKHDHIIFYFENDNLRYNDTRKFGTMHLFKKSEYSLEDLFKIDPLNKIGDEPFDIEIDVLYNKLKRSTKAIKTTLLDQSVLAGLGNIYVDEVLFMCKLDPEMPSNMLGLEEVKNIKENSIIVLNKAIKLGGTTIRSFQSSHDITGRFQNELLVHTKEYCPLCNSKIEKIKVNGRGTYLCPSCQKRK